MDCLQAGATGRDEPGRPAEHCVAAGAGVALRGKHGTLAAMKKRIVIGEKERV